MIIPLIIHYQSSIIHYQSFTIIIHHSSFIIHHSSSRTLFQPNPVTLLNPCDPNSPFTNTSSILTNHGTRCPSCKNQFLKSQMRNTMCCVLCGTRMHIACAQETGVFVVLGEGGEGGLVTGLPSTLSTPLRGRTRGNEKGDRMMVCRDCSRLDPASLRLTLLRNCCCSLDLLSIVDPVSPNLKLLYADIIRLLISLSPVDMNEGNRISISILVSMLKKGNTVRCLPNPSSIDCDISL